MHRKPGAAGRDDNPVVWFFTDGISLKSLCITKLNHQRVYILTLRKIRVAVSGALTVALFRWSISGWIQKKAFF